MKNYTGKQHNQYLNQGIVFGIFWLCIWEIGALVVDNVLLLPGPIDAIKSLLHLAQSLDFYKNVGWTMTRCVVAMGLSFFFGMVGAWAAYEHQIVRGLLRLPVSFLKAVPVMAIILYVILIASSQWVAIIVCFFMGFPIVYTNLLTGLDSMNEDILEVVRLYQWSRHQVRRYLLFPSLLPQIKASINLLAGLSWKAVVAAEVLSVPKYSLGYEMMNAKYYLDTAQLFAYIFVIVMLSVGFEQLIHMAVKKLEWRGYEGSRIQGRKGAKLFLGKKRISNGCERACGDAPEIKVINLTKSFGKHVVFHNKNIKFPANEVTFLSSSSGSGKTTLARLISKIDTDYEGDIRFSTTPQIAYLFQEDRLVPWLSVFDNLLLATIGQRRSTPDREEDVIEMAKALEIDHVLNDLPQTLSGGMRHRVAMGRTFLAGGNVLILDEPYRGLDYELRDRIKQRLWKWAIEGKTVIFITHELERDQQI